MEYLHRLIDQILNLLKYYSIRLIDIDSEELNKLIEILYAYVQLITLLYDDEAHNESTSIMMIKNDVDQSDQMNDLIKDVEDFAHTLSTMKKDLNTTRPMGLDNCQNSNSTIDDQMNDNQKILQSPIIKSRVGNIFHLCPMLLNDPNIAIRLNLLKLSHSSMRLLRSYEDILLPYVHRFWDSLVLLLSLQLEHPVVVKNAFDCLMLANELCGDFLLRRTSKEIIPSLITFLQIRFDKRIDYYRKHGHTETLKTVDYYVELELLRSLGQLAVNVKLRSEDIWKMLPIFIFYTCSKGIMIDLQRNSLDSLIIISDQTDYYSVRYFVHIFLETFYENEESILPVNKLSDQSKFQCICRRRNVKKIMEKYSNLLLPFDHPNNLLYELIKHLNHYC
ncbi:hypothetical protein BLA29_003811 [Euroglyphus maynei]|uniref:TTI1 C-terminal TPR domain-containing protein n=1 Tax=Euroglyphus maynei TaxID=6958 RepID=A0A1Y3BVE8_EURMA|nr:hypothetical protein BLA29_003811 [Euroglyphus maynei]